MIVQPAASGRPKWGKSFGSLPIFALYNLVIQ
jgi:hypothetical protein